MARIRSIKPDFWTSEQVMECSPIARLMFIGLWNFADDHGRAPASPKTIKAQIFPADDIDAESIRRMLDELASNDLIQLYELDGKAFLWVTGWHHQKIDKRQDAKYPPPPKERSSNGRRTVATDLRGSEGKGSERSENAAGAAPPKYVFESGIIRLNEKDFQQWTDAFPRIDLAAELLSLSEWASQQRSWFNAVKGALAKRNREAKVAVERAQNGPEFKWNGIEGVI